MASQNLNTLARIKAQSGFQYERHKPEHTDLYHIIDQYWPNFQAQLSEADVNLPAFIHSEFNSYLKCGLLEHGFLRVKCKGCRFEHLVAFSCKLRGFCASCGARRIGARQTVGLKLPLATANAICPSASSAQQLFINHQRRH